MVKRQLLTCVVVKFNAYLCLCRSGPVVVLLGFQPDGLLSLSTSTSTSTFTVWRSLDNLLGTHCSDRKGGPQLKYVVYNQRPSWLEEFSLMAAVRHRGFLCGGWNSVFQFRN
ncbi:hypothetical protein KC19_2G210700 [Ceratodon purpureus]|uniref:Uncharacterized protein n=1 Tax=Ceratodon purpureus TaxID=3225 RepID=A0A8T0IYQ9_CERPU|nr:hypothetical protein KC19_2G210700 [Ceratodon purpureus]